MKNVFLGLFMLGIGFLFWFALSDPGAEPTQYPDYKPAPAFTLASGQQVAGFEQFFDLHTSDTYKIKTCLDSVKKNWHPGSAVMLVEMTQLVKFHLSRDQVINCLEEKTGQQLGDDAGDWMTWIWTQNYEPHPQYTQFKSELYAHADDRFKDYFQDTDDAKIRLDEIRWGGIKRDEIPPLQKPKMIPATHADYLSGSNVVFGVSINGDHRCYPKRILAWHEMFNDTIGGVPVCGVY